MPPQKKGLQCLANKVLVECLRDEETKYQEKQKDRMVITIQRAIRSIMEHPGAIRNKEEALKLKGIGEFLGSRVEAILRQNNLLNVQPPEEEMVAEEVQQPVRKADICNYSPRPGSHAYLILIATVKCCGELGSVSVEKESILHEVNVISPETTLLERKFVETIRLLCKRGVLWQRGTMVGLTPNGYQLGVLCFQDSRLQYPVINQCIEYNLLNQLASLFPSLPSSSSSSSSSLSSSTTISTTTTTSTSTTLGGIGGMSENNGRMPQRRLQANGEDSLDHEEGAKRIHGGLSGINGCPSSSSQPPLVLPRLEWPLAPPGKGYRFGEFSTILEEDDDEEEKDEGEGHGKEIEIGNQQHQQQQQSPLEGTEEDWEVVLLLDNREVRTQQDRAFLHNQLHLAGIVCDVRSLGLGDMQWIVRHRQTGREVMLSTLVERKNTRDFAQSIMDGRFNEQQYRLMKCGCVHPIYLIEGSLRSQDTLAPDHLQTGIMTTVVNRDLYVYMSTSIDDTVVFLNGVHERMKDGLHRYFELGDVDCLHPQHLSFEEFQTKYCKQKDTDLAHLWCKQLRQIPRCSVAKVEIIVSAYPTLQSLLKEYNALPTIEAKEGLLKQLCDKKGRNTIGLALSRTIYHCLCG